MKKSEHPNLQYQDFIEKFNFSTIISATNNAQTISHVPVLLDRKNGKYGTLVWHMSKTNPHVEKLNGTQDATCIIHGPHTYISPDWYESAPNVPTWNYAVMHLTGIPIKVSRQQLSDDLSQMVIQQEMKVNSNYVIPDDYISKLIDHIVGFRMEINDIHNKLKLGLNRSMEDQNNVITNLQRLGDCDALSYVDFIQSISRKDL